MGTTGKEVVRDRGTYWEIRASPRIDDIFNAGDGDGGLGHIGGHDDFARRGRGEHPFLLPGAEPGKQGQDHGSRVTAALQGLAGFANILLGRHEDQDIAPGLPAGQLVNGLGSQFDRGALLIIVPGICTRKEIAGFHRVEPPGNLDHRRVVKGFGKLFGNRWWPR